MTTQVLFFSTELTQERLSWIDQALKYYTHQGKSAEPPSAPVPEIPGVTVFLTGDALYSLNEVESRHIWTSILSLPAIRLVCNSDALDHRGIPLVALAERFPVQVSALPAEEHKDTPSFWAEVISATQDHHPPGTRQHIGWLLNSSPYMFPSAGDAARCLSVALGCDCGISLYAHLDGCHACHAGQIAGDRENIGAALELLAKQAAEKHLPFSLMVQRYSAAARGYQSWDDGLGTIGSSFTIKPAHIRDTGVLIGDIENTQVLLSENAGCVRSTLQQPEPDSPDAGQVNILITHSPYSTEHTYGGIAFAVACAHQGIRSRVIFLEDGVYSITGEHRAHESREDITMPDLIAHLSGTTKLQFFALVPSFHMRGILKSGTVAAVQDIGFEDLGALLFPKEMGTSTGKTRILIF
jgi:tRNA 2-thiouridine synthesizing protein C